MKQTGSVQMVCDYGSKSSIGTLLVPNMTVEDYSTAQTKLAAFHAALKAANLTDANAGDIGTTYKSESMGSRPEASVNVKEQLEYAWRTDADSKVRTGTICGLPKSGAPLTEGETGDVLNATGKAALAAALEGVYGLSAGDVIVLWGKAVEKR
jgi:hypothetical protein